MRKTILLSALLACPAAAAPAAPDSVVVRSVSWDGSWKPATRADWVDRAAKAVAAAAKDRVDFVVFPDNFTANLAPLAPKGASPAEFVTRAVLDELRPALAAAAGSGPIVVLGSYPHGEPGGTPGYRISVLSGGSWTSFDRVDLTPAELAALPGVKPGVRVPLYRRAGGLFTVLSGYSLQKPELASPLKKRGLQLVLVPSAEGDENGAARVLRVASSRAVELGAAVIVAAPAGSVMFLPQQKGIVQPAESAASDHRVPWKKLLELRERATDDAKAEARPFLDPTGFFQVEL